MNPVEFATASCAAERRMKMLYPLVKLITEKAICTCGCQNYRLDNDRKPIYKVYEVTIPQAPCGSVTFHLCTECLKMLRPPKGE